MVLYLGCGCESSRYLNWFWCVVMWVSVGGRLFKRSKRWMRL